MTGPDPAVAAVRHAVRRDLADLPADSLVVVACSGGPDSVALAAATAFVAPRAGLRAAAVVVDHGLQPGSAQVAAAAAQTCRGVGLAPVEVVRVDVAPQGEGPEAAARAARYRALEDAATRLGAAAVLLGHTADDQAETVLLRLARGSGARSLAGMPRRRGLLRRPLLDLPRTTTAAACGAQGLRTWADPHNRDATYARVRARRLLEDLEGALGPGVSAALARSADLLRDDADALDAWAERALAAATCDAGLVESEPDTTNQAPQVGGGAVALEVAALVDLPPAVRRRVLHRAALAAGVPGAALAATHVRALDALLADWHGQGTVALPGGVEGVRRCGTLSLSHTPSPQE